MLLHYVILKNRLFLPDKHKWSTHEAPNKNTFKNVLGEKVLVRSEH